MRNTTCFDNYPKIEEVLEFVKEVRNYLFPCYFERSRLCKESYRANKLKKIKRLYTKYICCETYNKFVDKLPELEANLKEDLKFFLESDPAIETEEEVIITYPGYLAITYYRIAHILASFEIPYVPRVITESAHSLTGIDIHPNANIGVPFFIDHGTGIVIGETSDIGKFVKIYHGVTLGALSLKDGASLRGKKRHPTIQDHVTIYSGASILGGDTVIGENVTIGSNVFIVNSVLKDTKVIYRGDN